MAPAEWVDVASLDTAAAQRWTGRNLVRCDPYLVWSDAVMVPPAISEAEESARADEPAVAVLVELKTADDWMDFQRRMNPDPDDPASVRFVPNGREPPGGTRFITGQVNGAGLGQLLSDVAGGRVERFLLQESRLDIARRCGAAWTACQEHQSSAGDEPVAEPSKGEARPGTYLGIIDDGLPALRVARAVAHTGLPIHFWDQGWQPPEARWCDAGAPAGDDPFWDVPWQAEAATATVSTDAATATTNPVRGHFYGRRLKPISEAHQLDLAASQDRSYFHPPPRQTHGAAVLGLLAPWLSEARGPVRCPPGISGLAMVQLPTRTVVDTSGGSLALRVLDGLRHVLWQEEADRSGSGKPRPVVVNVSYGVHAGPHDGSSMFERAVLEMLDDNPHLHLVLPAGNAARAGCHAGRVLSGSGGPADAAVFSLQVLPDNSRDSFVEIWLPPGAAVSIELRPPGSTQVFGISEGEARIHLDPEPEAGAGEPEATRRVHFGAIYPRSVAQGLHGTMALVVIGSTRRARQDEAPPGCGAPWRRREVVGQPGLWQLKVRNLTEGETEVHAWVERGDAAPDASGGSRQAYFPDSCHKAVRLGNSTPEGTLNGLATMTHERLHVVGAMRADGALSDYSAAGPARHPSTRTGPDAVVTADASRNLPGIRTLGFVPGAIDRINGTSAACAVFARALAGQLADTPGDPPPEVSCVTDAQPEADPRTRGLAERRRVPYEVDL